MSRERRAVFVASVATAALILTACSSTAADPAEAGNCQVLAGIYADHLNDYMETVGDIDPGAVNEEEYAIVLAASDEFDDLILDVIARQGQLPNCDNDQIQQRICDLESTLDYQQFGIDWDDAYIPDC